MLATHKSNRQHAFTLIELLVVISIIALLMGILLPVLGNARKEARAVVCAAQQKALGSASWGYINENKGRLPPSYIYKSPTGAIDYSMENQGSDSDGYVHWSYFLFRDAGGAEGFMCPEFKDGGVARTNPGPNEANWHEVNGEQIDANNNSTPNATEDLQAPYVAFAFNAAVVPRNKFFGLGGPERSDRFVDPSVVFSASETILAAEYNANDWRSTAVQSGGKFLSKSHRSITPFLGVSGVTTPDQPWSYPSGRLWKYPEVNQLRPYEVVRNKTDLVSDNNTTLNAVGRNHTGDTQSPTGVEMGPNSNFLYLDGHSESKNVIETVIDREWGDKYYSITGNQTVVD